MTALRPERGADDPMSYEDTGAFRAVVEQLDDPLNDPLPGRPAPQPGDRPGLHPEPPAPPARTGRHSAPRPTTEPATHPGNHPAPQPPAHLVPQPPPYGVGPHVSPAAGSPWFRAPDGRTGAHAAIPAAAPGPVPAPAPVPIAMPAPAPDPAAHPGPPPAPAAAPAPVTEPAPVPQPAPARFDETVPMETLPADPAAFPGTVGFPEPEPEPAAADEPEPFDDPLDETAIPQPSEPSASSVPSAPSAPGDGGRAARRKAARQGGGGHRARSRAHAAGAAAAANAGAAVPLSRIEARRAAKAAKDSPAVVISRIVGELFITVGVVMLLFVTYQLWWTNVRAHEQANSASNHLEHQWATTHQDPNKPGVFAPGQGFAIMYIPKLDVKAPIAQGVSKSKVLDHGMIGHYDGQPVNTAMPWDKSGNFAVAAHRNTHGEPFRYINKLVPGDKIVVETATTYYTYQVTSTLPSTPPSNVDVLKPVPPGSGFTQPGRYITLTTCTPEFTSLNRLIVWGRLVAEQPRSQGKPAALLNG